MRIKTILQNKSVNNGIWLYVLQAFNTIIPLLTVPYATRILGQSGYGSFSIALNLIAYLQVLIEYGFELSATREIVLSEKDKNSLNRIFTSVIFSRFILYVISIMVAGVYLLIVKPSAVIVNSIVVMLVCLVGYCIQPSWLFHGMQEMKYVSIINIISRTISTILIFVYVKSTADVIRYSILYTVAPLFGGIIGYIIVRIRYKLRIICIKYTDILLELKKGWYVFTTQFSSKVFGGIGLTFLGIFSTEAISGSYSAIQKIPNVLLLSWLPISQVLYPLISHKMGESYTEGRKTVKKYQKVFVLLFLVIGILIALFAKRIVGIAFGTDYVVYSYWVYPLIAWLVISINNNFLGIQTLLSSGHDKEYSVCFQIGVVCTILLNLLLVNYFGGDGAAFAPLISEFVLYIALKIQVIKLDRTI